MLRSSGRDGAAADGAGALAKRGASRWPREERLAAIEIAARSIFCRRGYGEASIAEIAAEAGIAEGTIYKFFASKRELMMRVIERWYEQMLAEFNASLPGIVGARNKVRFIIWRHLSFLKRDLDIARLCLHEGRNSRDYYQSQVYQLNRRYTHLLLEALREGVRHGEFRVDTPITLLRDMVFGGIDHHTSAMLFGHGDIDPERSAELMVGLIFAGIEPRVASAAVSPDPSSGPWAGLQQAVARLEAIADRIEGEPA